MGVTANSRSIVHSGDGSVNTAAPPDVCKTPSPGGPVPIPYVNIANDSDLAKGAKKVKIEGNPVGLESSNLSTSSGDEAGTAGGGVVSSKFKGKLTWGTSSSDVKAEGKGVTRFMDVAQHNGNSFNTVFQEMGGTGLAYLDDFKGQCQVCGKGPEEHRALESRDWQNRAFVLRDALTAAQNAVNARVPRPSKKSDDHIARGGTSGYMVGTMECRGPARRDFAAMSGAHRESFQQVAEGEGYTVIVSDGATADDFIDSNTMLQGNDRASTRRRNRFRARFAKFEYKYYTTPPGSGWNIPGSCAGAKLVAQSGHKPQFITEFFWAPPGGRSWSQRYRVYRTDQQPPNDWAGSIANRHAVRAATLADVPEEQEYQAGQSVASCHTCQRLLYMTQCDRDENPCE